MPVVIPTPEEVAAMPWHARSKAQKALKRLWEAHNLSADKWVRRQWSIDSKQWAEAVMAEARGLWEELGPHPEAARNQAILLGVIDGAH